MAKIAYILLCHKDPDAIIAQAEMLTAAGDFISIHFDGRARAGDFRQIRTALASNPNVTFARQRVKCGWGEWSLVKATLLAVEAAVEAFAQAQYFYMLSGDCAAIKSARYIHEFLDAEDVDYIESLDYFSSNWIKTGMKEERLIYRHFFNERKYKWLFDTSFDLQRRLGLARNIPADIQVQIGSQWWCLRRATVEALLAFIRERPDVIRFFRTTWIPDETFFQTLVRHLVPDHEICARTLTFLMFTDYGMPQTFYNDHYDLLLRQDYLFARKISPQAHELKQRLAALYADADAEFPISNEGHALFGFVTAQGRVGRRFAPRFWEAERTLGQQRELLVVVCKKWHVAKRLLARLPRKAGIVTSGYVFDEEHAGLPDLGGIETSFAKRMRHQRALIRLLFECHATDRMVICVDPRNLELLKDLYHNRSLTRLLEIQCSSSDAYLIGYALRCGFVSAQTKPEMIAQLLPTLRLAISFESERLHDAAFEQHHIMREQASAKENAAALAKFLGIPYDEALMLVRSDHLFAD